MAKVAFAPREDRPPDIDFFLTQTHCLLRDTARQTFLAGPAKTGLAPQLFESSGIEVEVVTR
ncbi:hypothetical protein D9M71_555250 [compost metagenome]